MEKPRSPNPLIQPADEVLKSAIYLENDPNFKLIVSWFQACYAVAVNRQPNIKDEVELRWMQGQCQALLMINKALTQAREELQARQAKEAENRTNRNL